MKNFDKEIRELLHDAEMSVSSGLWDKIEHRIETRPDKPKYWMFFFLLMASIPAFYTAINFGSNKATKADTSELYLFNNNTTPSINSFSKSSNNQSFSALRLESTQLSLSSIDISESNLSTKTSPNVLTITQKTNKNTAEIYDQPLESILLKFGSIDELEVISNIESDYLKSNTNPVDKRPLIQRLFVPGTPCPKFKRKLKGIYAWADVNSSYADQSFSNKTSSPELESYSNLRASSEKSIYSFSASIGFGYAIPSGWFVESGITYDQINTQFQLLEENVIGTEEVIRNTRDSDGNITGTVSEIVPIIGTNNIRHNNRIKQYEVPLLVGYEMPLTPGLYLSIKGGPNFNLSSSGSGRFLDVEGNPISFGDGTNNNTYKQNLGIGYLIGGQISKDITDNISLNLGMTYKSYGDIQNEFSPLSQSITKYGLSTGIKYRFL